MDKLTGQLQYRILVISDYRDVSASRPEAEIFIRLAQLGHRIDILSFPEAKYYNQRFLNFGIQVIENHPIKKFSISNIRFLRKLVLDQQYDIVHAFNSKGLVNAIWALTGIKAKLIAYRGYAGQTHWYDPMMYSKFFHPRVDHIICVSKDIEHILAENMIGSKHKLTTIPKGHDPKWYEDIIPVKRNVLGFTSENILVCFVANLRPFKGFTYLLEATHSIPQELPLQFLFIGRGYEEKTIQRQMDNSPWKDRMHVLGYRSDALSIVATCDCLVLASTHGEGLSKSVVEAISLGIAPIITDIPGNAGLVMDGESGWIVPIKNPESISKAITEMARNPSERKRRGKNARKHITKHFHIDQTVKGFLSLYEKLFRQT